MTDLLSLPMQELTRWVTQELGEPKYRAKQLYDWLHKKQVRTFGEMSSLPAALRQRLGETAFIAPVESRLKLESQLDGTKKFLFALGDGNCVEAVWMEYHHGPSLCISTQVGCRMGCKFCASTLGGLVRNLTPGELLGEVYEAQRQTGRKISSLVLIGGGAAPGVPPYLPQHLRPHPRHPGADGQKAGAYPLHLPSRPGGRGPQRHHAGEPAIPHRGADGGVPGILHRHRPAHLLRIRPH